MKDVTGWPVRPGYYVRVRREGMPDWNGWVLWTEGDELTLEDEEMRCRHATPGEVKVVPASAAARNKRKRRDLLRKKGGAAINRRR